MHRSGRDKRNAGRGRVLPGPVHCVRGQMSEETLCLLLTVTEPTGILCLIFDKKKYTICSFCFNCQQNTDLVFVRLTFCVSFQFEFLQSSHYNQLHVKHVFKKNKKILPNHRERIMFMEKTSFQ